MFQTGVTVRIKGCVQCPGAVPRHLCISFAAVSYSCVVVIPKRTAYYTTRHPEQLLTIRNTGISAVQLEDVRELMQAEKETGPVIPFRPKRPGNVAVWSHVYIADGLELHIQPEQARLCPENLKNLVKRINIVF